MKKVTGKTSKTNNYAYCKNSCIKGMSHGRNEWPKCNGDEHWEQGSRNREFHLSGSLIQLHPEEVGETDDPKYCPYHQLIIHLIEDCFIFKAKIKDLVEDISLPPDSIKEPVDQATIKESPLEENDLEAPASEEPMIPMKDVRKQWCPKEKAMSHCQGIQTKRNSKNTKSAKADESLDKVVEKN